MFSNGKESLRAIQTCTRGAFSVIDSLLLKRYRVSMGDEAFFPLPLFCIASRAVNESRGRVPDPAPELLPSGIVCLVAESKLLLL